MRRVTTTADRWVTDMVLAENLGAALDLGCSPPIQSPKNRMEVEFTPLGGRRNVYMNYIFNQSGVFHFHPGVTRDPVLSRQFRPGTGAGGLW